MTGKRKLVGKPNAFFEKRKLYVTIYKTTQVYIAVFLHITNRTVSNKSNGH